MGTQGRASYVLKLWGGLGGPRNGSCLTQKRSSRLVWASCVVAGGEMVGLVDREMSHGRLIEGAFPGDAGTYA